MSRGAPSLSSLLHSCLRCWCFQPASTAIQGREEAPFIELRSVTKLDTGCNPEPHLKTLRNSDSTLIGSLARSPKDTAESFTFKRRHCTTFNHGNASPQKSKNQRRITRSRTPRNAPPTRISCIAAHGTTTSVQARQKPANLVQERR